VILIILRIVLKTSVERNVTLLNHLIRKRDEIGSTGSSAYTQNTYISLSLNMTTRTLLVILTQVGHTKHRCLYSTSFLLSVSSISSNGYMT